MHFKDLEMTKKCLFSLIQAVRRLQFEYDWIHVSLVVVDNSGNLDLQDIPNRFTLMRTSRNMGYAGACYLGASTMVDADWLVFSNNDVSVTEDSLMNIFRASISLPTVGAIQPLVLKLSHPDKAASNVDSIGLTWNPLMYAFNYSNWPIRYIREIPSGEDRALEVFGVDGMFIIINGKAWKEVEGWDPDFFMFNEDGLLSWKLRLAGYSNYVMLNSVIYHMRGGTAEGHFTKINPVFSSYYTSRNKILSMLYLYKATWIIKYVPMGLSVELAKNLFLAICHRDAYHLVFYFKALRYIFSNGRKISCERSKVRKTFDEGYFLRNSMILGLASSLALLMVKVIKHRSEIMK